MKKLILILAVIALVSFETCVPKTIDIDVKPADPELCISSIVLGNNGIVVGLTRSYSPLERPPGSDTLSNDLVDQILVHGLFQRVPTYACSIYLDGLTK